MSEQPLHHGLFYLRHASNCYQFVLSSSDMLATSKMKKEYASEILNLSFSCSYFDSGYWLLMLFALYCRL